MTNADVLSARLSQTIEDLRAGRITPAHANQITKATNRELRVTEAALRLAKLGKRSSVDRP